MLARSIGPLNDLELIRDRPGAPEAVLAAEPSDRDGGTSRPDT